jgi:hypothetical protein
MEKKRDQIKNMNKEEQGQFAAKMMVNAQRGQMINHARPQMSQNNSFL